MESGKEVLEILMGQRKGEVGYYCQVIKVSRSREVGVRMAVHRGLPSARDRTESEKRSWVGEQ